MKPGHLLLVDDDRHVLDSMADWLREQGYRGARRQRPRRRPCAQLGERPVRPGAGRLRLGDGDGFEMLGIAASN